MAGGRRPAVPSCSPLGRYARRRGRTVDVPRPLHGARSLDRGKCRRLRLRLRHDADVGLRRLPAVRIVFLASSSETEPAMMTSSPCFQFTGVATLCLAVSCSESITRRTSSKLRPGGHRIDEDQLDLLVRADDEDVAHRLVVGGGALGRIAGDAAGSMP